MTTAVTESYILQEGETTRVILATFEYAGFGNVFSQKQAKFHLRSRFYFSVL